MYTYTEKLCRGLTLQAQDPGILGSRLHAFLLSKALSFLFRKL